MSVSSGNAPIDLRSDTVTRPSEGMRDAMMSAPVGDDVYGEDETVMALEEEVAKLLGKDTALFVPSGTMSNQIAIALHCAPGDTIFCGKDVHVARYESGAAAALSGVQFSMSGEYLLQASDLELMLFDDAFYRPRPRLLTLENTHNEAGGRVHPLASQQASAKLARARGLAVHLDGARLWNAATKTSESLVELVAHVDTVSVCFSKGLGAPIGSALVMPKEFREGALRFRRRFGGAMRQAGIIAAAALYALRHQRGDLAADHRRAALLSNRLRNAGFECVCETNIVRITTARAVSTVERLKNKVLLHALDPQTIRAVVHRDLGDAEVERAADMLLATMST